MKLHSILQYLRQNLSLEIIVPGTKRHMTWSLNSDIKKFEMIQCKGFFATLHISNYKDYPRFCAICWLSVQMRENNDQNNSEYGDFLRSV